MLTRIDIEEKVRVIVVSSNPISVESNSQRFGACTKARERILLNDINKSFAGIWCGDDMLRFVDGDIELVVIRTAGGSLNGIDRYIALSV